MTWQIAILTHQILEAAYSLLYRRYASKHKHDKYLTNALMYLLTVLPAGIAWSLLNGGPDFSFDASLWLFFVIGGVLFGLGNSMSYLANTKLEAGVFSVIYNSKIVVTVIASTVLLSEGLVSAQFVGLLLVLGASIFVSTLSSNFRLKKITKFNVFTVVAFMSAMLIGLGATNEKYLLDSVTLATYFVVGWGFQTLVMVLLARTAKSQVKKIFQSKAIFQIVLMGVLRTLAGFAIINALVMSGNSSVIASVTALHVVLVSLGGYIFLKEKDKVGYKFLAAAVSFVGVILLVSV